MRRLWEATSTVPIHHSLGTPLHAKTMVVERILALIGITNLDNRSFALNEEINLIVHDAIVAGQLEKKAFTKI